MYYHVGSRTMNPCNMLKEVYAEARRTWLCQDCGSPRAGSSLPTEIPIQNNRVNDPPLNIIDGAVGVIHRDLLNQIGEENVNRYLIVGNLVGSRGRLIHDWVTFRGRYQVIVRGTKEASWRRCSECLRVLYFSLDPTYLYPMPPADIDIFESDSWGLVMRPHIFERLNLSRWKKKTIDALNVPEAPPDGLGILE